MGESTVEAAFTAIIGCEGVRIDRTGARVDDSGKAIMEGLKL